MGRIRILKKGAKYNIRTQVNRQELIFKETSTKKLLLKVIEEAKEKYNFIIVNFCIMGNHVHMIIQPQENESLSKIMQWILSIFARRYNKIKGYIGHIWIARFHSKIIDDIAQLITTFRRITDNPIRLGLVKKALEYEYNGIWFLKNKNYSILAQPEGDLAFIVDQYL